MRWFTVHVVYLLTQVALAAASIAAFVQQGVAAVHQLNGLSPVLSPWASFGVSGFAVTINVVILVTVYLLQRPSASSTEEGRALRRRYVLGVSAVFALAFASADAAFAALFGQAQVSYACALAAVAAVAAAAALAVDIWKIWQDASDIAAIRAVDAEQFPDGSLVKTNAT